MANFTSVHTGATIDASVTIISGSGVTQSDLTKLNAVTSSAVELNILDGVTASTSEINILDGLTASTTELNYLDGADSSITTLSLPDNTTITTFGASLVDDADAATARTTLGVDVAGTDNSTDVTLVTTSYDYLSLSGQAITLGQIDISDDTNLVGGDGLALTGDTLSVNVDDSSIEINSDTLRVKALGVTNAMLAGSIANAKLSNSTVSYGGISLALGASDATPAFDLSDATSLPIVAGTTGTLSVARGGTGATTASGARTNLNVDVAGTDNSTDVTLVTTSHDYLSLSGQAVTLGQIDISDDTNLVGGTGITLTGDTLSTTDSEIVHDNLSGFVANEHIDHSGVSITAGAGLTGGGDITATRDIAVGAGTGVTVNANDVAIGQDVGTNADVTFNSVTSDDFIGSLDGAVQFEAKATVALNKGDAVYVVGISGNTPTIALADANDAAKMPSFGLAASSASIDDVIEVVTFGTLTNINTSAFSQGDVLFISSNGTSGNTLTATKEAGESVLCQNIGKVIRSHATVGSIKVGGAGRANATPNLNDGNIFIGNGSNQAVTAALNTKIQDYLNTGVNLPSPTFTGDIDFSDATTPSLSITDSTNPTTTIIRSQDGLGQVGTTTSHNFGILSHNSSRLTFASTLVNINPNGDDYDVQIKDSSNASLFRTDAANSRVGILDSTPSYTLDVNGTGRFTGAVQLDDNLTVTGDLQVNGTTTTVNQTNLDVSDNIIGLNRGASTNANDSGIIIERGSTGDNVFIGWKESSDRIRFATTTADASATGNLTLTNANVQAGRFYGDVTGNVTGDVTGDVTGNADTATALATGRDISLTGDVTGTTQVAFDGSGNASIATTIAANSVALGTDTTGNYMSDLTEGTGIDITHTPAEGSNATITLDLTEVGFGGGANRLITDDGDGTVSTEANLTFDGLTNTLNVDGSAIFDTDTGNQPFYITRIGTLGQALKMYVDDNNAVFESIQDETTGYVGNFKFVMDSGSTAYTGFLHGTAEKMRIQSDGNVGIGTTSPNHLLEIEGQTNDTEVVQISNDAGGSGSVTGITHLGITHFPGNTYSSTRITAIENGTASYTGHLAFSTRSANTDSAPAERMRIASSGNVGIGTVSPDTKLDITASGVNGVVINQDGSNADQSSRLFFKEQNSTIALYNTGDTFSFRTGATIDSSSGTQRFYINTSGATVAGNLNVTGNSFMNYGLVVNENANDADFRVEGTSDTHLLLTDAANNRVGIGTASPGALLDVNGTAYLRTAVFSDTFKPYSGTLATYGSSSSTDHYFVGDVGIGTNSPQSKLHNVQTLDTVSNTLANGNYGLLVAGDVAGVATDTVGIHLAAKSVLGTPTRGASILAEVQSTGNNHDLIFATSAVSAAPAERMRITDTGNVGIGNNSPSRPLQIGFTTTNGEAIKLDGNASYGASIYYSRGGGYNWNAGVGGASSSTSNIPASYWGVEDVSQGNAVRLAIAHTTGYVGIGTVSPSKKLHIKDSTNEIVFIESSDANADIIGADTGGSTRFRSQSGSLDFYTGGSASSASASGSSFAMRIDTSQRVGIGTTTPSGKLDVQDNTGSLSSTKDITAEFHRVDATYNPRLQIRHSTQGTNIYHTYSTTAGLLTFGNGGTADAMAINSSGSVGIGNTSPGYKLDVSGNVRFTSDLRNEGRLLNSVGSSASPSYSFFSQGNAGMYRSGDGVGFSAGGSSVFDINSTRMYINTNVGIGTTTPYEKLDVKSASSTSPAIVANGASANGSFNMAHGYDGANGDYVCTYSTQYSTVGMVLGYGVKASTTANDTFLCSADNSNFVRGAFVLTDTLKFWTAGAQTGTLNNNITMTERFRVTPAGVGHFDNDVVAYSSTVSDKRLKENITTIDNALDKVMALRGVEYDWTATSRKGTHDIGLVAQEVEEVIPELVTEHELCTGEFGGEGNEKTFKTVNYDKVVGVLIEAIKEQQQQINELKEKLNG